MTEYECSMAMLPSGMRVLGLAIIVTGAALASARAQDSASAWATAPKSAARLIAAPDESERGYRAGIEIKLAP